MKIIIFDAVADLHKYCAQLFLEQVVKNPQSRIGFATGVSPVITYQHLVADYQTNHTSWNQIVTFNLDEFVGIDPNHPEAFIQQMKSNLFNHIDLNPNNIHIPNSQTINPEAEADAYEQLIQQKPIDFQYISLGINGHMAYNEPGTPLMSHTHVANLSQATKADLVQKQKFGSLTTCPQQAITMGIQTILNYTKKVIMVAYGANKAEVTQQMLEDKPNSAVTASYLQWHPDCTFILDAAAARLLSAHTLQIAKRI